MKLDSDIKTLVEEGKRKGFLTYEEVNRLLPEDVNSGDKIDRIFEMLEEMGIAVDAIDRFLVAGAFGNHLNVEDSMALGLLPEMPREKVFFVGNSSLEGARCVLLNRYERQRAERIAEECGFVELATRPEFQDRFAMAMMLVARTWLKLNEPRVLSIRSRLQQEAAHRRAVEIEHIRNNGVTPPEAPAAEVAPARSEAR